jgi:hypothetical protein
MIYAEGSYGEEFMPSGLLLGFITVNQVITRLGHGVAWITESFGLP